MYVLVRINDGEYSIDDLLEDGSLETYGYTYCKNDSFRQTNSYKASFKRKNLKKLILDIYENSIYYNDGEYTDPKFIEEIITYGYLLVKVKGDKKYVLDPEEILDSIRDLNIHKLPQSKPEVSVIESFEEVLNKMTGKFKSGTITFLYKDDDELIRTQEYKFDRNKGGFIYDKKAANNIRFYHELMDYYVLSSVATITVYTDSIVDNITVKEMYAMRLDIEGDSAIITIMNTDQIIKSMKENDIYDKNIIICDLENRISLDDI